MSTEKTTKSGWESYLFNCSEIINNTQTFEYSGIITKVTGLVMESVGMDWPIGSACTIPLPDGKNVEAEVVGFDGNRLLLMPQSSVEGIRPGAKVVLINSLDLPHKRDNSKSPPKIHSSCARI